MFEQYMIPKTEIKKLAHKYELAANQTQPSVDRSRNSLSEVR